MFRCFFSKFPGGDASRPFAFYLQLVCNYSGASSTIPTCWIRVNMESYDIASKLIKLDCLVLPSLFSMHLEFIRTIVELRPNLYCFDDATVALLITALFSRDQSRADYSYILSNYMSFRFGTAFTRQILDELRAKLEILCTIREQFLTSFEI